jgi:hypothetical protein
MLQSTPPNQKELNKMVEQNAFEQDFEETQQEQVSAEVVDEAPEAVVVVEEAPADGAEEEEDDFFAENQAQEVPQVDPTRIVTLTPSSASSKYVEVDGPTPVLDLIVKSGLRFQGTFTVVLNGAELQLTDLVPGGSELLIAGTVKGG